MILQHTGHAKSIRATIRDAAGARSKVVNVPAKASQAFCTAPMHCPDKGLQLSRCAMQAVDVQGPGEICAGANRLSARHPPERDIADGFGRA